MFKLLKITGLFLILFQSSLKCDELADKLEALVNAYDKLGIFSGNVLLAKDGKEIYSKTGGYSNWETKSQLTKETLFNICSLNKVFTHAIILQLQNEGKLNLSDPLSKYLQIFPKKTGNKITINMLLEMSAGLGDYLMDPNYMRNISNFKTVNDYLELIKNEPLLYEPGTDKMYSNSGYAVLGGIIEKVTGKSYEENLSERFLAPLGMNSTYYRPTSDVMNNAATPTRVTFSGTKMNERYEVSPSPAGGIYSNISDMLKFDNELRKTNIFGANIVRAGGSPGWNSVIAELDNGYTLIVMSNFSRVPEAITERMMSIVKGKDYPAPDILPEMKFYKLLKEGGIAALKKDFKNILQDNRMEYNDNHLNMFGYGLMQNNETELAIEVFKLNAELFPDIPNVFDSLAEAYMNHGDKDLAILNYKKVLQMAPGNQNAKKMLEKLGK